MGPMQKPRWARTAWRLRREIALDALFVIVALGVALAAMTVLFALGTDSSNPGGKAGSL